MLLPHGPAGVSRARRRLTADLTALGVPESAVDDAALVLSELLSNAFRHGRPLDGRPDAELSRGEHGGIIRVSWQVDGPAPGDVVTLEVTDGGGPTLPRTPRPSLTAHGGRGLGIVEALSLDWGVRDRAAETTVWSTVALRPGAAPARRPGGRSNGRTASGWGRRA
ncbi:hypothetical protein BIV57_05470 [Mangrovactinospora gilvigrisea]|uniref:Histidine kinase/HSP90-like ATPase domain-containing protein n=1 Tax=Mangrovactinospora gilvigrisea TaxID=1428644 RepID=A0A1J7BIG7_9ACTN|nr:ATP-binding protein [Mangrovactinospora gilvigrisea]OIV38455.1 hypothetical protein BIV57_05470 [Mangrovactinospora gilvigrisea]